MKPIIINIEEQSLEQFRKSHEVSQVFDAYRELLEELFLIRNPRFKFDKDYQADFEIFLAEQSAGRPLEQLGVWFYFPWNKIIVHYLPEEMHQELRTARNRNIILAEEQKKFYEFKIGVAGLSVGSHAALTLAMMGAGKHMRLADPDVISGSNLNRLRYDFTFVNKNKCDVVTEQVYQMNPYADLRVYPEGVTDQNIGEFLDGLDVLVEELDNLELKIRLRIEAKKRGIPVVMATDNGDNIIFDIERYDLDPNLEIFNGVAGHLTLEEFQKMAPQELPRLATKIAGKHFVTTRMQQSLLEVGRTLYSWPQLGDAATLSGVAVAYVVKRLALGEKLKNGKMEVNLDEVFDPEYHLPETEKDREEQRRNFLGIIGLED